MNTNLTRREFLDAIRTAGFGALAASATRAWGLEAIGNPLEYLEDGDEGRAPTRLTECHHQLLHGSWTNDDEPGHGRLACHVAVAEHVGDEPGHLFVGRASNDQGSV